MPGLVPAGVVRGLLGGAGMLTWLAGASAVAGRGVWLPVNTFGHALLRGGPPGGAFDIRGLAAGLGVHIVVTSMLGVLFAAVFVRWLGFPPRLRPPRSSSRGSFRWGTLSTGSCSV